MDITGTTKPKNRIEWRSWLEAHHQRLTEIWLLLDGRTEEPKLTYLDTVEEAICFGWIDGIQKRFSANELAQRFTPRKRRSNWTELNKERARRLIRLELMTEAGSATLPDLHVKFGEEFKQFGMAFYLAFSQGQHNFDEVIVSGDPIRNEE